MTRHGELGTALHRWRDRTVPADPGVPAGEPRDSPGLRREELAQLAGLPLDYVIRLEEGRATSPSVQVLTALARALELSDDERRHLFLLAGQSPPAIGRVRDHIPPSVRRLLDRLADAPLSVYDASWNLVTWNPQWAALVGDPSERTGRERNVVWRHFTGAAGRVARTPEQEARFEAAVVADLRAATVRYPTDEQLRFLIAELRRVSGRFVELWNSRITGFHGSDNKTVDHPDVGLLTLDYDILTVPGSDLRIAVYSAAPSSEAADKLALLGVIGTETMPGSAPGHEPMPAAEPDASGPAEPAGR
ncbi:helix-turn-helix transcriptional regulator [Streptomyces sp. NPDC088725]|uniref:helix-turn-helix transcriptional regulator n=1 Tax=Streptomyces sp. NPDC088725 TaxID=3365873 RepID=UPI0038274DD7